MLSPRARRVRDAEKSRRWREANPDKVQELNKNYRAKYKEQHPGEIGTRDNPIRDTRFKKGMKKSPSAGREFQAGHIPVNKGKPAHNKGTRHSLEAIAKIKEARSRQVMTVEHRQSISRAHRERREESHLWRGGITEDNKRERNRIEYRLWREAVFVRDDYTCQDCGRRGCVLNADHVKPFAYYPELRFDVGNGRTLCVPCHKNTDSYKGRAQKNYGKK